MMCRALEAARCLKEVFFQVGDAGPARDDEQLVDARERGAARLKPAEIGPLSRH